MFKNLIVTVGVTTALLSAITNAEPVREAKSYPDAGIVTNVDYKTDTVEVTMFNGNMFEFYGTEDWYNGDIAALIMSDNGTDIVYDDAIIDVKYAGHVSAISTSEVGFYMDFRNGDYWYEYEE